MIKYLAFVLTLLACTAAVAQTDLELTGSYNVGSPDELLLPIGGELTMFFIISNTTSTETGGEFTLDVDGEGDFYIKGSRITRGGSGSYRMNNGTATWPALGGNQTAEYIFTIKVDGPTSGEITGTLIYTGDTNPENNIFVLPITVDAPLGSISGTVWDDFDRNAIYNDDELVVESFTVYLDQNNNGQYDSDEPAVLTDFLGQYEFPDLEPGTYKIGARLPLNWVQTFPEGSFHEVVISDGTIAVEQDFGVTVDYKIQVKTFNDLNGNGQKDEGEPFASLDQVKGELSSILLDGDPAPVQLGTPVTITGMTDGEHTVELNGSKVVITTPPQVVVLTEEAPDQTVEFGFYRVYELRASVLNLSSAYRRNIVLKIIEQNSSINEAAKTFAWDPIPDMKFTVRDRSGAIVATSGPEDKLFTRTLKEGVYSVEWMIPDGLKVYWSLGDGLFPGMLESVDVTSEGPNRATFAAELLPPEVEVTSDGVKVTGNDGLALEGSENGVIWFDLESGILPPEVEAVFFRQAIKGD